IIQITPNLAKHEVADTEAFVDFLRENSPEIIIFNFSALIKGRRIELSCLLESGAGDVYDLRISWRPYIVFFNSQNLKERFSEIFELMFLIGKRLDKDKIFFNSKTGAHPGREPNSLIEI